MFVHVSFEHFHLFLYLTLFITVLNGLSYSLDILSDVICICEYFAWGFCMFILYLAPLLNYFVFFLSFFIDFSRVFHLICIRFCLQIGFVFSFLIVVTNFSCLIALAKTSNVILDKGSGRRHPCLVANFKGKISGVSALNYK